ncbi:MAG TPA: sodium ion-translocating decarboxylase subunit beta [candidate division Zixibacteria bacterium]|nr:sodium ion-translocating decarboxylase subunit beta [candidate division Zixibacteria bacterium]
MEILLDFLSSTGIFSITIRNIAMMIIGGVLIYLGISKKYEPLLLVPIGFGAIIGNMFIPQGLDVLIDGSAPITAQSSVFSVIYFGVKTGVFPALIFMGVGAMTDFSSLISNPKTVILGAAAQVGVFLTFFVAVLVFKFDAALAAAVGLIGGADGPTSIFLVSKLAPDYLAPVSIAAYSYMSLVPIIQPPIMKLLTSKKERLIRMPQPREVSTKEKIFFPIVAFIISAFIAPGALPLLGLLFLGNLLKESGVTNRLAKTAANAIVDTSTIFIGLCVGLSAQGSTFLTWTSISIFVLGVVAFGFATVGGVLFAKLMNVFSKHKVNPLIGAAGVSAVPNSARVVQMVGRQEDPDNHLLMHAMGPNVAGVIGTAIAAGIFLSFFG